MLHSLTCTSNESFNLNEGWCPGYRNLYLKNNPWIQHDSPKQGPKIFNSHPWHIWWCHDVSPISTIRPKVSAISMQLECKWGFKSNFIWSYRGLKYYLPTRFWSSSCTTVEWLIQHWQTLASEDVIRMKTRIGLRMQLKPQMLKPIDKK